ncbi:MAG: Crp/Fnr family transcriptional regulator [Bacteroidia bacterium]|nr:Crp/Fnr family transcriptional regulator [Bacteroidia bacterium]
MKKRTKSLHKSGLLYKYCSKDWHTLIDSNIKHFLFKKGQFIFKQGDKVEGIHIIVKGKVKVSILGPDYPERILRLAGPDKLLGHRGIANSNYPITATALTDCEILFLPNDIFISLLRTNPDLSLFLINFLAEEIRNSEERLINLIQLEVKERMACVLSTLAESFGFDADEPTKLSYTLSRTDFASFVGTTYESVIRTLFALQKNKLIKLDGKEIHIINMEGLKKMLKQ